MIENVSTQLTVFHCFAHCLLPGRAFASLYVLLFLEKEAEIGGRDLVVSKKKNPLFVSGWIEKSVPSDHCLSSLGKPHNANR